MNFEDNALNCYEIVSINSLYRDAMTNSVIRQASALQKPQIPISNLMSVIAYYKHNGIHNMYCQGTADLVIDFCTDYWDGKEIKSMSYNQRYENLLSRDINDCFFCFFKYLERNYLISFNVIVLRLIVQHFHTNQ
jgi:hypothetical protein